MEAYPHGSQKVQRGWCSAGISFVFPNGIIIPMYEECSMLEKKEDSYGKN